MPVNSSKERRGFIKGLVAGLVGAFLAVRGAQPVSASRSSAVPMPRLNLPPFVVPANGRPVDPARIGPSAVGPPPYYTEEIGRWHRLVARTARQPRGTIGQYEVRLDLSEVNRYDQPDNPYSPVIQWSIVSIATASNGEVWVQSRFSGAGWTSFEERFGIY
jgi:hypothetical protein